ncbi:MAG: hypothetical protein R2814_02070 [Flavobacteriaceae bacterium]
MATDVISESLGHQNLGVTIAHLKELDTNIIEKGLEEVLKLN